ncbi:MAG: hypothetical protein H6649_06960 [Caldilineae bacterium]|nr:hypothetical protein [Anaerolineae bacterium]MCB0199947.1 hypothetical protein [Anaerolineae bacterium]MCB9153778.1 hypothetical protein [Caldilineae bacterium]
MNKLNSTTKPVEVNAMDAPTVSFVLPDAASAGEDAMEKALAYASAKMGLSSTRRVIEQLQQGNAIAVQYASYGLAVQVAQTLGTLDDTVQTAYLFEDYATPEDLVFGATTRMSVNLIARVTRKTKAFESLAQALSRALAVRYGELMATESPIHVLSIHAVDSADINGRIGLGALVTSLHNQPMKVWQR